MKILTSGIGRFNMELSSIFQYMLDLEEDGVHWDLSYFSPWGFVLSNSPFSLFLFLHAVIPGQFLYYEDEDCYGHPSQHNQEEDTDLVHGDSLWFIVLKK